MATPIDTMLDSTYCNFLGIRDAKTIKRDLIIFVLKCTSSIAFANAQI